MRTLRSAITINCFACLLAATIAIYLKKPVTCATLCIIAVASAVTIKNTRNEFE